MYNKNRVLAGTMKVQMQMNLGAALYMNTSSLFTTRAVCHRAAASAYPGYSL